MKKTVTLKTFMLFLMLVAMMLPIASFAQNDNIIQNWDDENGVRDFALTWTITNNSFGTSPLGSGLFILAVAGAGYAVARRRRNGKNGMTLFLALMLMLGMTNCKKNKTEPQNMVVKQIRITLDAGGHNGAKHTINTTTGVVEFQEHDLIYVGNNGKYIGTLECNNSGVFTGEINEPVNNTEVYFYFVGGLTPSSSPVKGTTSSFTVDISDQHTQMPVLSSNHVTYLSGTSSYSCELQNHCALVKFTANTNALVHVGGLYTEALIDFEHNSITNNGTTGFINLKSESQTDKWAVLLPQTGFSGAEGVVADQGYTFSMPTIEADAFLTSGISFGSTSSHNRYLQWAAANLTLQNGDHVYGTLAGNYKVSIADGATVTLHNVTINGVDENSYNWAGLNCLGDATIILADGTTNTVKGFYNDYPGIYVSENKTVTIQGSGSLTASSNGYGAGIGGGYDIACGNIEIQGGVITATGGDGNAAGIGGGGHFDSCGTITISGGNITANGGVNNAAGIGTGANGTCGNITISGGSITANGGGTGAGIGTGGGGTCLKITITSGVTSVTATKGSNAPNSIGAGEGGTCGTVTIGGVEGAISDSPYTYEPPKALSAATAEDKGKVAGQDGKIYDNASAATSAGTTAVAKIIYIGTTGHATYSHGLALALTDEGQMAWEAAIDACSAKNTSTPVTDATWLLASKDQWDYMLGTNGAGSYTALRDGFSGITGASNLQSGNYWSSTEADHFQAWFYGFVSGHWYDGSKDDYSIYVRACLAF